MCGSQRQGIRCPGDTPRVSYYEGLEVRPDYTKSTIQVYEDFVTRYLQCCNNINILTACRLSESWIGPSWVPDWSTRVTTRVETRIWSASLMFASAHFAPLLSGPENGKLHVTGLPIGTTRQSQRFNLEKQTTSGMNDTCHPRYPVTPAACR